MPCYNQLAPNTAHWHEILRKRRLFHRCPSNGAVKRPKEPFQSDQSNVLAVGRLGRMGSSSRSNQDLVIILHWAVLKPSRGWAACLRLKRAAKSLAVLLAGKRFLNTIDQGYSDGRSGQRISGLAQHLLHDCRSMGHGIMSAANRNLYFATILHSLAGCTCCR